MRLSWIIDPCFNGSSLFFLRRCKLWTFNAIGPLDLGVGEHIWNINTTVRGRPLVWNKLSCFCLSICFLSSQSFSVFRFEVQLISLLSWSSYSWRLRCSSVSWREWRWFKASTSAWSSAMRSASLALAADIELVLETLLDLDPHSEGLGLFWRPNTSWEALSSGVTGLSWSLAYITGNQSFTVIHV